MGKEATRRPKAGVCLIVLETAGARVAGAERVSNGQRGQG